MSMYLLDTDTCIAFLKGKFNMLEQVEKAGFSNCFISEITVAELIYGAYYSSQVEKHKNEVVKIRQLFSVIPIEAALDFFGKEKARLRKEGKLIHDFDLFIGSTAVVSDMIMVTGNVKHLQRISGIRLENWMNREET